MSALSVIVIFSCVGVLGARQTDIQVNRIDILPDEEIKINNLYKKTKDIEAHLYRGKNDYDHSSGRTPTLRPPLHPVHDAKATPHTKENLAVYQPREDPRFFYQSDAYLQEINKKNISREVSEIFPGREVLLAGDLRSLPSWKSREMNQIPNKESKLCIKCPHDRILVARPGSNQILLQAPRLFTCSRHKAPKGVHFVEDMGGPKFGSLLDKGSHMIIGRIAYKNKTLRACKMRVEVVIQICATPKHLVSHCDSESRMCNFSCRNPKLELHGHSSLRCNHETEWEGQLPACKVRGWCDPPSSPKHGHISCHGAVLKSKPQLAEGAKCRVRCSPGFRRKSRAVATCRRGTWTHALECYDKKKISEI